MPPLCFQHLYKPAEDRDAPPLLLLHGTGGSERDLLGLGRELSPGSALLAPRGQVSERGAARFFARIAEGIFDPAEVRQRTHELADFIADAATRYRFDVARLIAVGFSNGANIAASLLLLRPIVLGGAVLFRPMIVIDAAAAPGSLTGKRVFIGSGTTDPIVPNDHPLRLAAHLRAGGADVILQSQPTGHGLSSADVAAAREWLRQGVAAPSRT